MKREDFYNAPKYAAIYMFRNKINNKCYIGQAIKLRKRLLHHLNNLEHERYDAPIYRAFAKYGLENFELVILRTWHDALSARTKYELDTSEKQFIQEYNAYAPNGYNQTLGGDGGVLGYKFNEQLIKVQSDKAKIVQNDGRNSILVYNIKTGEYKEYTSKAEFARCVGLKTARAKNQLHLRTFLIGKDVEDIERQKQLILTRYYRNTIKLHN